MSFVKFVSAVSLLTSLASFYNGPSVLAQAQSTASASATVSAADPVSTICGDIIDIANQDPSNIFFQASAAHDCLLSVPFLDAVALRFIEYYNTTLQFQSTLAYLRNPPESYQQPAVDVLAGLEQIRQNISAGYYKTQYDFEATVQSLVYRIHDAHVDLLAGILSAFSFGSWYDIMSVSVDGKQAPQVYLAEDVVDSQAEGWTPSPVVAINGENTEQYLRRFAAQNSVGQLEPHADWNQLMYSPVQDITGELNTFGWGATFYEGDNITFTFANGTSLDSIWFAIYQNGDPTGPLTTGGDFYNYFVLGLLPASYTETDYNATFTANDTYTPQTSWFNTSNAYPEFADVYQPDLALQGGGFLTGYFYNDSRTAVFSVPSFDEYGNEIGSFSNTTANFISRAKEAGMTRVVIDLQANIGGAALLAIDTFRQFFPNIEPFTGSRRRSHRLANILGGATTEFWDSLTPGDEDYDYDYYYNGLAADEWVVTDRLNAATGQNFSSWQEYYGPLSFEGDTFSLTERYNLSSEIFDAAAFDGWIPAGYYDGFEETAPAPWDATDIVILTDGICSSTCTLFLELMTHQAGVRSVVVGGLPEAGPMQAGGGSRGAAAYAADILDDDFTFAGAVNLTANTTLPQVRDPGMYTVFASFNLRDQVRENDSVPLQFQYEAANCRIYFTFANVYNLTRLWHDTATATWDDPSLCVAGSTGYASSGNSTVAKPPPTHDSQNTTGLAGYRSVGGAVPVYPFLDALDGNSSLSDGLSQRQSGDFSICSSSGAGCAGVCHKIACSKGGPTVNVCLPSCPNINSACYSGGVCRAAGPTELKQSKVGQQSVSGNSNKNYNQGLCYPSGSSVPGCPYSSNGGPPIP